MVRAATKVRVTAFIFVIGSMDKVDHGSGGVLGWVTMMMMMMNTFPNRPRKDVRTVRPV